MMMIHSWRLPCLIHPPNRFRIFDRYQLHRMNGYHIIRNMIAFTRRSEILRWNQTQTTVTATKRIAMTPLSMAHQLLHRAIHTYRTAAMHTNVHVTNFSFAQITTLTTNWSISVRWHANMMYERMKQPLLRNLAGEQIESIGTQGIELAAIKKIAQFFVTLF